MSFFLVRRARVRPQFAKLYPEIVPGVWISARRATRVVQRRPKAPRGPPHSRRRPRAPGSPLRVPGRQATPAGSRRRVDGASRAATAALKGTGRPTPARTACPVQYPSVHSKLSIALHTKLPFTRSGLSGAGHHAAIGAAPDPGAGPLLSIPAGVVAQTGVENYATRAKVLVRSTLRLRYGTTAQQLPSGARRHSRVARRASAAGDRDLAHPSGGLRISGHRARAFAYVLTADVPEFLAVREDLLLRVAGIVESSGSAFAQPTRFVYLQSSTNADRRPDLRALPLRSLSDPRHKPRSNVQPRRLAAY